MSSLFEGTPTQATSGQTATAGQTPQWYQDLLYQQMSAAKAVADMPFEPYSMPRVAGQTPDQTAAYQSVRQNIGAWQPSYDVAMKGTQSLAGETPGVTSGVGYMQAAAGYNPMLAQQPYVNQASAELGNALRQNAFNVAAPSTYQAMGMSGLETASPFLMQGSTLGMNAAQGTAHLATPANVQAMGMSGLETAAPFLRQGSALGLNAAQSSAPLAMQYMNPYTDAVTNQIAQLGARNLSENLLPAVSDQFIRAGQFGGSRMGEFGQRALRDTQESILREQSQALQQGYGQALGASQTDLARMLQAGSQQAQLGQTAGAMTAQQQQLMMQGGQNIAQNYAQDLQRMLQAGQAQTQIGQIAGGMTQAQQQALMQGGQNLAGIRAQDLDRIMQGAQQYAGLGQQVAGATNQYGSALQNIGQGIGSLSLSEAQRQQSALGQLADLGTNQQRMVAQDAAAMEAVGQAQQSQKQRELDAAYQQFQEQQRYPQQQLDWYQAQLKGTGQYLPSTTTQSGYTTEMGQSPLAQLATGFGTFAGLREMGSN